MPATITSSSGSALRPAGSRRSDRRARGTATSIVRIAVLRTPGFDRSGSPSHSMPVLRAAEVDDGAVGRALEQRLVRERAVVLVGDHDHRELRVVAQEAGVAPGSSSARFDRAEVLLDAAAVDADVGDRAERIGERAACSCDCASPPLTLLVDDEAAVDQRRACASRRRRRCSRSRPNDAVPTPSRRAAGPCSSVDDADVDVRQRRLRSSRARS